MPTASRVVQRKVNWGYGNEEYYKNATTFVKALYQAYPHVPKEELKQLVVDAENQGGKPWAPSVLWSQIGKYVARKYVTPPSTQLKGLVPEIPHEDLRNYWDSTFKTVLYAMVDGKLVTEQKSETDVGHAEINLLRELDKWILQQGWKTSDTAGHELVIIINNSCCMNCSWNIYHWDSREYFHSVSIHFANPYEKDTHFTPSTLLLRAGGIDVKTISVTSDLLPAATGNKDARFRQQERAEKDTATSSFYQQWQNEHSQSSAFVSSYPNLHVPPNTEGGTQKLEGFKLKHY